MLRVLGTPTFETWCLSAKGSPELGHLAMEPTNFKVMSFIYWYRSSKNKGSVGPLSILLIGLHVGAKMIREGFGRMFYSIPY